MKRNERVVVLTTEQVVVLMTEQVVVTLLMTEQAENRFPRVRSSAAGATAKSGPG